ncbi:oxidoreductase [Streptacidiphilus pinicola]|uniref:Oxidoreductase n=1 Tax=Streptacidiphilus pinicola TaxID=2219663 RepID=A0A2X0KCL1_9ACTN|nr:FAD/NAD(P)-binding protein [Streptacidiphilus pinicola]RAG86815.1 oxidoreductase [Streptacidiphilus pinicola]
MTSTAVVPDGTVDAAIPLPYLVRHRLRETADTVTLDLVPLGEALPRYRPGQFSMLYAFGIGEIPVSVSAIAPGGDALAHTVRAVGKVSEAICRLRPGEVIGVRGPFGNDWALGIRPLEDDDPVTPLGTAPGEDLVVMAGGLGLSPLRPVVLQALSQPGAYGWLTVLVGARSPQELVHRTDLTQWHALGEAKITVDRAEPGWTGAVGLVTDQLRHAVFRPERTTAFVCGPEPMMRASAEALLLRGVAPGRIRLSLERNMRCATAWCGHCQLGQVLVCRDGPVFTWEQAAGLLAVHEL